METHTGLPATITLTPGSYILLMVASALVGAAMTTTIYRYRRSHSVVEVIRLLAAVILLPGVALVLSEREAGYWLIWVAGAVAISLDAWLWRVRKK